MKSSFLERNPGEQYVKLTVFMTNFATKYALSANSSFIHSTNRKLSVIVVVPISFSTFCDDFCTGIANTCLMMYLIFTLEQGLK